MSSEWPQLAIGSLAKLRSGYSFKSADWKDSGNPVIKIANVKSGRIEPEGCGYVDDEVAAGAAEWWTKPGDVLVAMTGYVGEVARVRRGERYLINQRVGRFEFTTDSPVDSAFFFYVLRQPDFRKLIEDVARGSAQPNLSSADAHKLKVPVPPRATQIEIAALLMAMDDRIALLRETNATLEAIAQALFKSWFADFDPVRAKSQGLTPAGMDEAAAAMFPDGFEESALGPLPRGWRVATLSEAFEINPSRSLRKGTDATYLEMAGVPTSGHCADTITVRAFGSGTKFRNGDTLLARITPCLENGKTAFVDFLADGETGWGSTEFIVLRPRAPLPEYFAYLLCRHAPFREFAERSMSGTSGRQRVQNDVLSTYRIAMPPAAAAEAFGTLVKPLQLAIAGNHARATTLGALRDALLPRLISGQLRLPAVIAEAEEAL